MFTLDPICFNNKGVNLAIWRRKSTLRIQTFLLEKLIQGPPSYDTHVGISLPRKQYFTLINVVNNHICMSVLSERPLHW